MVDEAEVLALLIERIRIVMALDDAPITAETRFDEDLHADSLDLVEVIEAVERKLASRGVDAAVPDDDLAAMRTVGDAARRVADQARRGEDGG